MAVSRPALLPDPLLSSHHGDSTMFIHMRFHAAACAAVVALLALAPRVASAQVPDGLTRDTTTRVLPFPIDSAKRLSDADLARKRTGRFITGLPRIEFDPIRGFGAGGNLFLFQNGTPDDPFFAYTPYRSRVSAELFVFANGRIRYALQADKPYIFNTKWRVRADAVLWEDPEAQYWGMGRTTLNDLTFADKRGGTVGPVRTWRSLADYEDNLALAVPGLDGVLRTDVRRNAFIQRERLYNLLAERTSFGGRLRVMFGYEALFTAFEDYSGRIVDDAVAVGGGTVEALHNPTRLAEDQAAGVWKRFNASGFSDRYRFTSMLAGALIWDTRDFEPDPTRGVFLEYSHEYTAPWTGSDFDFNKAMAQAQGIRTVARSADGSRRLTLAGLAALGHIWGSNINFIEMWDLSSQAEAGGILVLGGARSLRGYREARFLAPTTALVNLEVRLRLGERRLWNQDFSVGVTPFYDAGNVYDRPADITLAGIRSAAGVGARIGWNQSTIIRVDVARSREGQQTFLGFGHIF
jgi:hypothetical protein